MSTTRRWIRRLLLVALAASCSAGCAPFRRYHPRPSPRIQITGRTLAKDGQEYQLGQIGWLVRGNAPAEHEARAFARKSDAGLAFAIVGIVLAAAGSGTTIGGLATKDKDAQIVGLGISVVSISTLVWAIALSNEARDHVTNAVNLYNDALPAPPTLLVPAR